MNAPDDAVERGAGARAVLAACLLLGGLGVIHGIGWFPPVAPAEDPRHRLTILWLGAAVGGSALLVLCLLRRIEPRVLAAMRTLAERIDALGRTVRCCDLVAASVAGLFLEVLLIRWHATELRAAAYFKNVTLLACFLGLGLGFAAADRPRLRLRLLLAPLMLAVQVVLISAIEARGLDALIKDPTPHEWKWGVPQAERDWSAGAAAPQTRFWIQAAGFYGFYTALFVSTILIFVPIGQLTGRLMRGLAPVRAYTLNILGSLAGVGLFAGVSFLWLQPVAWFALAGAAFVCLARHERLGAAVAGGCLAVMLAVIASKPGLDVMNVYSPYQRLEVRRDTVEGADGGVLDTGVLVSANKAYHLRTANLSREFVAAHGERFPRLAQMAAAYDLPHTLLAGPRSVLVVGAGGGNDVAAALRAGAERIDAVEIDPAIVELGRRYHAERPYDDPRVRVHVNDARAFMRRAPAESYDLIVFGLLDSHTLLSGMTAVRLDNFVYTQESMHEARRLLAPGGAVALSFSTGQAGYLATRLHNMLADAFDGPPRCFRLGYDDGLMFIASIGPGPASAAASSVSPEQPDVGADETIAPDGNGPSETDIELAADVVPATDDWPFLYLHGRHWSQIPTSYLVMIAVLAVISFTWVTAGQSRRTGFSPHFFFLGGAFLLIEVKGITELALVFGTTWIVNSVVIAAILALILLANLLVTLRPRQNRALHYAALAAVLVAGYFVRLEWLLGMGWWTAAATATVLLLAPVFFAGVIFATSLAEAASLPRAFSSNLLGAILGGLCEYSAMVLGFRNLYLVGLALYALSFLVLRPAPRARRGTAQSGQGPAQLSA